MYPYHSAIILSPGSGCGIARINGDFQFGVTKLMTPFSIAYPAERLYDPRHSQSKDYVHRVKLMRKLIGRLDSEASCTLDFGVIDCT